MPPDAKGRIVVESTQLLSPHAAVRGTGQEKRYMKMTAEPGG